MVLAVSDRSTLIFLAPGRGGLDRLQTPGHFTKAAYFRILLPDVMPAREAKVIYLDSDLLVRKDLSNLWRMDMNGMPVMAVRDFAVPYFSSKASGLAHLAPAVPPDTPFLNSGVMMIDLDAWRGLELSRDILEYSLVEQQLDQVAINAVVAGRWTELNLLWNVQVYINNISHHSKYIKNNNFTNYVFLNSRKIMEDSFIYHFSGGRKPWGLGCALPGQFAWLNALGRSGWHGKHIYYPMYAVLSLDYLLRCIFRSAKLLVGRVGRAGRPGSGAMS